MDYRKCGPSIAIQTPVLLSSSDTTVLKENIGIIAHINNNATLKPARRSRAKPGDGLSIWRGMAAITFPAPRSAAAGGRRSETRGEFSPRSHSGTSRRPGVAVATPGWGAVRRSNRYYPPAAFRVRLELPPGGREQVDPDQAPARLRRGPRAAMPPSGGNGEPAAAEPVSGFLKGPGGAYAKRERPGGS